MPQKPLPMALAAAFLFCTPVLGVTPLEPSDLPALHRLVKPAAEEAAWESIPWEIDLWSARQRAAREGKPILLWEMDGHPLGCT